MGIFSDITSNSPFNAAIAAAKSHKDTISFGEDSRDKNGINMGIFSKVIQEDISQMDDMEVSSAYNTEVSSTTSSFISQGIDTSNNLASQFSGLRRSKSCRHSSHFHRNHHGKGTGESLASLPSRTQRFNSRKSSSVSVNNSNNMKLEIKDPKRKSFLGQLSESGIKTHLDSHDLFPRIVPETLNEILSGDSYKSHYENYLIIDSRFAYEFEGGHIKNALNISSSAELESRLLLQEITSLNETRCKPTLLIFHCEFSSHRGPTLASHLRNYDRIINQDNYPELYYPDILILDGGYKGFYDKFPKLCYPMNYVAMNSSENLVKCEQELDKFRSDSKKLLSRSNSLRTSHSNNIFHNIPSHIPLYNESPHESASFLKFDAPPKLSFLSRSISDIATSDDNISSLGSSCTSVNKMLLMSELDTNFYDSLEENVDHDEEYSQSEGEEYTYNSINNDETFTHDSPIVSPSRSNKLCFNVSDETKFA